MEGATRSVRSAYRQLLHELNRRCRREFDRAERLQAELNDIQSSRAWRLLAWLRGLRRKLLAPAPTAKAPSDRVELLNGPFPPPAGLVSIVIPFRDRLPLLRNCLRGLRRSTYRRFEVLLVDNGSTSPAMKEYLDRISGRRHIRVLHRPGPFHFACLCNDAACHARGRFLLFLNNDVEPPPGDWLGQMLSVALAPGVGVVGATLCYPDGTLQHAGIFPGQDGAWSHLHQGEPADGPAGPESLRHVRAVPAVTGACLLIRRDLFREVGGFDERYPVTQSDVVLCQRLRDRGLRTAITPHARLIHFESLSRGYHVDRTRP